MNSTFSKRLNMCERLNLSRLFLRLVLVALLFVGRAASVAQNQPEEKLSMTFYALRNMYVDSVKIGPLVEQQMTILMQCLDPHSEYLTPEQARANEDMLLGENVGKDGKPRRLAFSVTGRLVGGEKSVGDVRMLDRTTGYMAVSVFVQSTIDEFHEAVKELRAKGMKNLVLDIRNNPGGFFDTALELADEFIADGTLVAVEGRHQPRQEVKAQKAGIMEQGKVVVLADESTMSASEIFAGAMQDWDRAVLMGRRTFGKGLIQETLPFNDGSAIRISVARYFTPSGRSIQKPYAGRPREEYFSEVQRRPANGSLPEEARSKTYQTMKNRRIVYGGGGIAPDVFVPSATPDDTLLLRAVELLNNEKQYKAILTKGNRALWTSFQPSIDKAPTCRLVGILPDDSYSGRQMVLERRDAIDSDRCVVLDSLKIEGRRFSTTLPCDGTDTFLHLRLSEIKATDCPSVFDTDFLLAQGKLTIRYDTLGVTVTGSKANDDYTRMVLRPEWERMAAQRALNAHYNRIQDERPLTEAENAERQRKLDDVSARFMQTYAAYVKANIQTPFANYLLFRYPLDRYAAADTAELVARCDPQLLRRYRQREAARLRRQQEFQASAKAMNLGAHYREIHAQTPDGQAVKLSDLVVPGHVTLLDFWASWCVPCQQEIPFLKELYAKFHDRGFDIISISLDSSQKAWLKSLDKNAMPWAQLSDLRGWNGPVTQDYGIQAIPFVYLLDRNGNIVLKNLHAHLLEAAISEQFEDE